MNLCTICARGGSKGVKNKNLRLLAGKPLIAYSIEQARAAGLFDAIAVSSDSAEILEGARASGADILIERPAGLATDAAPKLPAIRHCAVEAETILGRRAEIVVDLDATSPLRLPSDILAAVELLRRASAGNVLTAAPARRSPYFNLLELDAGGAPRLSKAPLSPIERRQDAPACYDMNASIYAWKRDVLLLEESLFLPQTRLYVMPEERSLDIDSELDFAIVEFLMLRRQGHAAS
jgi:CMP-N,N'-diacetyllegionaminic acid synthase